MKLRKKVFLAILLVFIIITIFLWSQEVSAFFDVNGIIDYMKKALSGLSKQNWFVSLISTFIAFIQVAVVGVATITFTIVGIEYFTTSAATAKAKLKGRLFNVFIGGVLAFSALQLAKVIFDLFNSP